MQGGRPYLTDPPGIALPGGKMKIVRGFAKLGFALPEAFM